MEPIFTDKQLNNMSREDLISLTKLVQAQTKKKDMEIRKRLIFWYDKKIPDYFSVAGAP